MDDAALKRETARLAFWAADTYNFITSWDVSDPITWALLRCLHAQSDLTHCVDGVAHRITPAHAIEAALAERAEAIAALQKVLEENPRAGFA